MIRKIAYAMAGMLAAALSAGCALAPDGGPSGGGVNLTEVCADRPSDDCATIVRRLNVALAAALDGKLASGAQITNNVFTGLDNHPLGGAGLTFVATADESERTVYHASLRIKASTGAATAEIEVGRYTGSPPPASCPAGASLAEMESKGMTVTHCGWTVGDDGTVLIVDSQTEPFSDGPDAAMVPTLSAQSYRPGGVTVSLTLEGRPVDDSAMPPPGPLPVPLTLDQLVAVAGDPALTL